MAGKLARRVKRQVRAEAKLRFGPQRAAIRQAGREVESEYATDVAVARDTARGAKRAARAAKPSIRKALGEALETTQAGPTPGVSAALGNLGPAAARDSEGSKRRLSESMAMATAELDQRRVDAESGKSQAILQATSERKSARKTLRSQVRDLTGQAGTFKQARAGELRDDVRDRRVTKRGQDVTRANARDRVKADSKQHEASLEETARHNRATEKNAKAKDKGRDKATQPRRESASSALSLARTQIQQLRRDEKLERGGLGPLLVQGRESSTVEGEVDGKPVKIPVPGVKKVNQLWASVALDIEFDGEISKANLSKLRSLGYGANMLGVGKYKPGKSGRDHDARVNKSPGSDRAQS